MLLTQAPTERINIISAPSPETGLNIQLALTDRLIQNNLRISNLEPVGENPETNQQIIAEKRSIIEDSLTQLARTYGLCGATILEQSVNESGQIVYRVMARSSREEIGPAPEGTDRVDFQVQELLDPVVYPYASELAAKMQAAGWVEIPSSISVSRLSTRRDTLLLLESDTLLEQDEVAAVIESSVSARNTLAIMASDLENTTLIAEERAEYSEIRTGYTRLLRENQELQLLAADDRDRWHTLKNILASMVTHEYILTRLLGMGDIDSVKAVASEIGWTISKLTSFIKDIHRTSLNDPEQLAYSEVEVNEFLTDITSLANKRRDSITNRQKIRFMKEDEKPLSIRVDQGRFTTMVVNLIDNASRHADPDSEIIINISTFDKNLVLAVTNKGKPLQPDVIEGVLKGERFGGSKSTGMGLLSVRNHARAHGGDILFSHDSERNLVTIGFRIKLG